MPASLRLYKLIPNAHCLVVRDPTPSEPCLSVTLSVFATRSPWVSGSHNKGTSAHTYFTALLTQSCRDTSVHTPHAFIDHTCTEIRSCDRSARALCLPWSELGEAAAAAAADSARRARTAAHMSSGLRARRAGSDRAGMPKMIWWSKLAASQYLPPDRRGETRMMGNGMIRSGQAPLVCPSRPRTCRLPP